MIRIQKEFMDLINVGKDPDLKSQEIENCVLGLTEELGELARILNDQRKIWRQGESVRQHVFKEELVDILAYLLELFILIDFDELQIHSSYLTKMKINKNRVEENND